MLVDSDVLAREVVAPGTAGLAEVVAAFGTGVLGPDGALDRPALAAVVFGDPQARERLNAIVHPRVRGPHRGADRGGGRPDADRGPGRPAARRDRLAGGVRAGRRGARRRRGAGAAARRGARHGRDDARARIAAQADDAARRAAADVGSTTAVARRPARPPSTRCGTGASCRSRTTCGTAARCSRPAPDPVEPGSGWAAAGPGSPARVAAGGRSAARGDVAHVGPTAVPGLPAVDVLDLQVAVDPGRRPGDGPGAVAAAGFRAGLDAAGFRDARIGAAAGAAATGEWRHAGADPGRPVRVACRPAGSPAWRADAAVAGLAARRRGGAGGYIAVSTLPGAAGDAARRHFEADAVTRAEDWAASSGWSPSLDGTGHPDAR